MIGYKAQRKSFDLDMVKSDGAVFRFRLSRKDANGNDLLGLTLRFVVFWEGSDLFEEEVALLADGESKVYADFTIPADELSAGKYFYKVQIIVPDTSVSNTVIRKEFITVKD